MAEWEDWSSRMIVRERCEMGCWQVAAWRVGGLMRGGKHRMRVDRQRRS